MDIGVFIPIGNNDWLISTNSPQYKPSFELNKQIVQKAEHRGLDFVPSTIKRRSFGGKTEFWNYNLESFTLMAGLATVTMKIELFRACRPHGNHNRLNCTRSIRYQYRHGLLNG